MPFNLNVNFNFEFAVGVYSSTSENSRYTFFLRGSKSISWNEEILWIWTSSSFDIQFWLIDRVNFRHFLSNMLKYCNYQLAVCGWSLTCRCRVQADFKQQKCTPFSQLSALSWNIQEVARCNKFEHKLQSNVNILLTMHIASLSLYLWLLLIFILVTKPNTLVRLEWMCKCRSCKIANDELVRSD